MNKETMRRYTARRHSRTSMLHECLIVGRSSSQYQAERIAAHHAMLDPDGSYFVNYECPDGGHCGVGKSYHFSRQSRRPKAQPVCSGSGVAACC
jgi:hypothetical protein